MPSPESDSPAALNALDVLIIGAGPVGLTMAAELTRYGLRVRIVDAAPAPSEKSKALVVWPRTLEHLDRMGLAGTFTPEGIHATRARLYQGDDLLAEIPLDVVETPFPYALMIPQDTTERLLLEHLQGQGIAVERGLTFTGYTEHGTSITAVLTRGDGSTETVDAHWLLGCDGAHSAVRHAIGASFEGETLPSDWVLADFHVPHEQQPDGVAIHFHADGLIALFPIPGNRVRVIANVDHAADGKTSAQPAGGGRTARTAPPTAEQIQRTIDTRSPGMGLVVRDVVWLASFHINERMVSDFRRGNVFLAGDAAHIHSPAGGQGMNTGMQDAVNLAWKLALVHAGELSVAGNEILLMSYSQERATVARDVLRGAGLLTRMATLENGLLRATRNTALHALTRLTMVQHKAAEGMSELAVAYSDSPLNRAAGKPKGPKPGERAPVSGANTKPVSAGRTPMFTLHAEPGTNAEQVIACYPDLIDPELRPPFEADGLWLVRPDGYVGFAGTSDAFAAADDYLGKLKWPQIASPLTTA